MVLKNRRWALILALTLVILAVIGLVVFASSEESAPATSNTTTSSEKQKQEKEKTESKPWPLYVNKEGGYQVRYKPGWIKKVCERNPRTVLFSPSGKIVCDSEAGAPVTVGSYKGDQRTDESAVSSYGKNVEISDATTDSVSGRRISYTHKGNEFVKAGTWQVTYEFFTSGTTYIATYSVSPGNAAFLADFDKLAESLEFLDD